MRTFFILVLFFLVFIIFVSSSLGNVDLTPNTPEVAQAAAPIATQPLMNAIQENPTVITHDPVSIPVTGGCADPYNVIPGDWLLKIAAKCNTTLSSILQTNPQITNPDLIYPDQQLILLSASPSVPVTGSAPGIQPGADLQVQVFNLQPNILVNVAIGPISAGYTVVASGITNADGNLTTHISIPRAPDSQTPWAVVVTTTSTPPIQVMSQTFYIQ